MSDPQIRDRVINLSCPNHDPAACQETDCPWCDNAADRADTVHKVFVEWLEANGHAAAGTDLLAAWHGFRMPPGRSLAAEVEVLQRMFDDSEGFGDQR